MIQTGIKKRDLQVLYPGRDVPLDGADFTVKVFPVGIQHVDDHVAAVTIALSALAPVIDDIPDAPPGKGGFMGKEWNANVLSLVVPVLTKAVREFLMEFVNQFIDVDIFGLSHWHQAQVIAAWLDENFTNPSRLRGWMEALDALGKMGQIHPPVKLDNPAPANPSLTKSPSVSPAATPFPLSSTMSAVESLTQAGVGPNSLVITELPKPL